MRSRSHLESAYSIHLADRFEPRIVSHTAGGTIANLSMDLVKRRLLSGGAWALGGRMTLAFIGLATNALLARLLSPPELGAYFLAYSVVGVGAALGALGLTQAVIRFVAESVGLGHYDRARRAIKLALGFGSLGAAMVGFIYLLFGGALAGSLFDSPALVAVTGVTGAWIVVAVVQGILVETFRGFHDIRITTLLGGVANGNGMLTGGLLSLLLLLLFLFKGEASLATVMLLAVASGATSALLAGWLLRRRVGFLPVDGSSVKLQASEVGHVAWPLMVNTLALFALGQASLWIVGAFLEQEDVALYGAAYRLMIYVAIPLQIANMVAPPLIAEMYAQGRVGELQRALRATATIAGIPALVLLFAFVFFGGPIMGFILGAYYREAALFLGLLSLGQMVGVWVGCCGQALMMTGHQAAMMAATIVVGLLTVTGVVWAVQNFGATGAAAATAGGIVLQNVVMLLLVRRKAGFWTHAGLSGLLSVARLGK